MAELRGLVLASHEALRRDMVATLKDEKLLVAEAANETLAYREIARGIPDLVVAQAGGEAGEDREALLVGLLATEKRPPFVVVTGESSSDVAAKLVRRGAFCSLRYPVDKDEARAVFRRALVLREKERERAVAMADVECTRSLVHDALLNVWDGVLVVDGEGVILFANSEAARILLKDPDRLVNTNLDPEFSWDLFNLLKAARDSTAGQASKEIALVSGGDARLPILARASLIYDHVQKPAGALLVMRALDPSKPSFAATVAKAAEREAAQAQAKGSS